MSSLVTLKAFSFQFAKQFLCPSHSELILRVRLCQPLYQRLLLFLIQITTPMFSSFANLPKELKGTQEKLSSFPSEI